MSAIERKKNTTTKTYTFVIRPSPGHLGEITLDNL